MNWRPWVAVQRKGLLLQEIFNTDMGYRVDPVMHSSMNPPTGGAPSVHPSLTDSASVGGTHTALVTDYDTLTRDFYDAVTPDNPFIDAWLAQYGTDVATAPLTDTIMQIHNRLRDQLWTSSVNAQTLVNLEASILQRLLRDYGRDTPELYAYYGCTVWNESRYGIMWQDSRGWQQVAIDASVIQPVDWDVFADLRMSQTPPNAPQPIRVATTDYINPDHVGVRNTIDTLLENGGRGESIMTIIATIRDYMKTKDYIAESVNVWQDLDTIFANNGGDCEDLAHLESSLLMCALTNAGYDSVAANLRLVIGMVPYDGSQYGHTVIELSAGDATWIIDSTSWEPPFVKSAYTSITGFVEKATYTRQSSAATIHQMQAIDTAVHELEQLTNEALEAQFLARLDEQHPGIKAYIEKAKLYMDDIRNMDSWYNPDSESEKKSPDEMVNDNTTAPSNTAINFAETVYVNAATPVFDISKNNGERLIDGVINRVEAMKDNLTDIGMNSYVGQLYNGYFVYDYSRIVADYNDILNKMTQTTAFLTAQMAICNSLNWIASHLSDDAEPNSEIKARQRFIKNIQSIFTKKIEDLDYFIPSFTQTYDDLNQATYASYIQEVTMEFQNVNSGVTDVFTLGSETIRRNQLLERVEAEYWAVAAMNRQKILQSTVEMPDADVLMAYVNDSIHMGDEAVDVLGLEPGGAGTFSRYLARMQTEIELGERHAIQYEDDTYYMDPLDFYFVIYLPNNSIRLYSTELGEDSITVSNISKDFINTILQSDYSQMGLRAAYSSLGGGLLYDDWLKNIKDNGFSESVTRDNYKDTPLYQYFYARGMAYNTQFGLESYGGRYRFSGAKKTIDPLDFVDILDWNSDGTSINKGITSEALWGSLSSTFIDKDGQPSHDLATILMGDDESIHTKLASVLGPITDHDTKIAIIRRLQAIISKSEYQLRLTEFDGSVPQLFVQSTGALQKNGYVDILGNTGDLSNYQFLKDNFEFGNAESMQNALNSVYEATKEAGKNSADSYDEPEFTPFTALNWAYIDGETYAITYTDENNQSQTKYFLGSSIRQAIGGSFYGVNQEVNAAQQKEFYNKVSQASAEQQKEFYNRVIQQSEADPNEAYPNKGVPNGYNDGAGLSYSGWSGWELKSFLPNENEVDNIVKGSVSTPDLNGTSISGSLPRIVVGNTGYGGTLDDYGAIAALPYDDRVITDRTVVPNDGDTLFPDQGPMIFGKIDYVDIADKDADVVADKSKKKTYSGYFSSFTSNELISLKATNSLEKLLTPVHSFNDESVVLTQSQLRGFLEGKTPDEADTLIENLEEDGYLQPVFRRNTTDDERMKSNSGNTAPYIRTGYTVSRLFFDTPLDESDPTMNTLKEAIAGVLKEKWREASVKNITSFFYDGNDSRSEGFLSDKSPQLLQYTGQTVDNPIHGMDEATPFMAYDWQALKAAHNGMIDIQNRVRIMYFLMQAYTATYQMLAKRMDNLATSGVDAIETSLQLMEKRMGKQMERHTLVTAKTAELVEINNRYYNQQLTTIKVSDVGIRVAKGVSLYGGLSAAVVYLVSVGLKIAAAAATASVVGSPMGAALFAAANAMQAVASGLQIAALVGEVTQKGLELGHEYGIPQKMLTDLYVLDRDENGASSEDEAKAFFKSLTNYISPIQLTNGGLWGPITNPPSFSGSNLDKLHAIFNQYSPTIESTGYNYVREESWQDIWQSSDTTIQSQAGDCEDYAVLAATLATANGIPAQNLRIVSGLVGYGGAAPQSHAVLLYDASGTFALETNTKTGKNEFKNPDSIQVIDLSQPRTTDADGATVFHTLTSYAQHYGFFQPVYSYNQPNGQASMGYGFSEQDILAYRASAGLFPKPPAAKGPNDLGPYTVASGSDTYTYSFDQTSSRHTTMTITGGGLAEPETRILDEKIPYGQPTYTTTDPNGNSVVLTLADNYDPNLSTSQAESMKEDVTTSAKSQSGIDLADFFKDAAQSAVDEAKNHAANDSSRRSYTTQAITSGLAAFNGQGGDSIVLPQMVGIMNLEMQEHAVLNNMFDLVFDPIDMSTNDKGFMVFDWPRFQAFQRELFLKQQAMKELFLVIQSRAEHIALIGAQLGDTERRASSSAMERIFSSHFTKMAHSVETIQTLMTTMQAAYQHNYDIEANREKAVWEFVLKGLANTALGVISALPSEGPLLMATVQPMVNAIEKTISFFGNQHNAYYLKSVEAVHEASEQTGNNWYSSSGRIPYQQSDLANSGAWMTHEKVNDQYVDYAISIADIVSASSNQSSLEDAVLKFMSLRYFEDSGDNLLILTDTVYGMAGTKLVSDSDYLNWMQGRMTMHMMRAVAQSMVASAMRSVAANLGYTYTGSNQGVQRATDRLSDTGTHYFQMHNTLTLWEQAKITINNRRFSQYKELDQLALEGIIAVGSAALGAISGGLAAQMSKTGLTVSQTILKTCLQSFSALTLTALELTSQLADLIYNAVDASEDNTVLKRLNKKAMESAQNYDGNTSGMPLTPGQKREKKLKEESAAVGAETLVTAGNTATGFASTYVDQTKKVTMRRAVEELFKILEVQNTMSESRAEFIRQLASQLGYASADVSIGNIMGRVQGLAKQASDKALNSLFSELESAARRENERHAAKKQMVMAAVEVAVGMSVKMAFKKLKTVNQKRQTGAGSSTKSKQFSMSSSVIALVENTLVDTLTNLIKTAMTLQGADDLRSDMDTIQKAQESQKRETVSAINANRMSSSEFAPAKLEMAGMAAQYTIAILESAAQANNVLMQWLNQVGQSWGNTVSSTIKQLSKMAVQALKELNKEIGDQIKKNKFKLSKSEFKKDKSSRLKAFLKGMREVYEGVTKTDDSAEGADAAIVDYKNARDKSVRTRIQRALGATSGTEMEAFGDMRTLNYRELQQVINTPNLPMHVRNRAFQESMAQLTGVRAIMNAGADMRKGNVATGLIKGIGGVIMLATAPIMLGTYQRAMSTVPDISDGEDVERLRKKAVESALYAEMTYGGLADGDSLDPSSQSPQSKERQAFLAQNADMVARIMSDNDRSQPGSIRGPKTNYANEALPKSAAIMKALIKNQSLQGLGASVMAMFTGSAAANMANLFDVYDEDSSEGNDHVMRFLNEVAKSGGSEVVRDMLDSGDMRIASLLMSPKYAEQIATLRAQGLGDGYSRMMNLAGVTSSGLARSIQSLGKTISTADISKKTDIAQSMVALYSSGMGVENSTATGRYDPNAGSTEAAYMRDINRTERRAMVDNLKTIMAPDGDKRDENGYRVGAYSDMVRDQMRNQLDRASDIKSQGIKSQYIYNLARELDINLDDVVAVPSIRNTDVGNTSVADKEAAFETILRRPDAPQSAASSADSLAEKQLKEEAARLAESVGGAMNAAASTKYAQAGAVMLSIVAEAAGLRGVDGVTPVDEAIIRPDGTINTDQPDAIVRAILEAVRSSTDPSANFIKDFLTEIGVTVGNSDVVQRVSQSPHELMSLIKANTENLERFIVRTENGTHTTTDADGTVRPTDTAFIRRFLSNVVRAVSVDDAIPVPKSQVDPAASLDSPEAGKPNAVGGTQPVGNVDPDSDAGTAATDTPVTESASATPMDTQDEAVALGNMHPQVSREAVPTTDDGAVIRKALEEARSKQQSVQEELGDVHQKKVATDDELNAVDYELTTIDQLIKDTEVELVALNRANDTVQADMIANQTQITIANQQIAIVNKTAENARDRIQSAQQAKDDCSLKLKGLLEKREALTTRQTEVNTSPDAVYDAIDEELMAAQEQYYEVSKQNLDSQLKALDDEFNHIGESIGRHKANVAAVEGDIGKLTNELKDMGQSHEESLAGLERELKALERDQNENNEALGELMSPLGGDSGQLMALNNERDKMDSQLETLVKELGELAPSVEGVPVEGDLDGAIRNLQEALDEKIMLQEALAGELDELTAKKDAYDSAQQALGAMPEVNVVKVQEELKVKKAELNQEFKDINLIKNLVTAHENAKYNLVSTSPLKEKDLELVEAVVNGSGMDVEAFFSSNHQENDFFSAFRSSHKRKTLFSIIKKVDRSRIPSDIKQDNSEMMNIKSDEFTKKEAIKIFDLFKNFDKNELHAYMENNKKLKREFEGAVDPIQAAKKMVSRASHIEQRIQELDAEITADENRKDLLKEISGMENPSDKIINEKEDEKTNLQKAIDERKSQLNSLLEAKGRRNTLEGDIQSAQTKIRDLDTQIGELETKQKATRERESTLLSKKDDLAQKRVDLEKQINDLVRSYKENIDKKNNNINILKNKLNNLNGEAESLVARQQKKLSEKNELKKDLDKTEDALSQLKSLEAEQKKQQETAVRQQADKQAMQADIADQIADLDAEIAEVECDIGNQDTIIEENEKILEDANNSAEIFEKNRDILSNINRENESSIGSNTDIKNRLDELRNKREPLAKRQHELTAQKASHEEAISRLNAQDDDLEDTIQDYTMQLNHYSVGTTGDVSSPDEPMGTSSDSGTRPADGVTDTEKASVDSPDSPPASSPNSVGDSGAPEGTAPPAGDPPGDDVGGSALRPLAPDNARDTFAHIKALADAINTASRDGQDSLKPDQLADLNSQIHTLMTNNGLTVSDIMSSLMFVHEDGNENDKFSFYNQQRERPVANQLMRSLLAGNVPLNDKQQAELGTFIQNNPAFMPVVTDMIQNQQPIQKGAMAVLHQFIWDDLAVHDASTNLRALLTSDPGPSSHQLGDAIQDLKQLCRAVQADLSSRVPHVNTDTDAAIREQLAAIRESVHTIESFQALPNPSDADAQWTIARVLNHPKINTCISGIVSSHAFYALAQEAGPSSPFGMDVVKTVTDSLSQTPVSLESLQRLAQLSTWTGQVPQQIQESINPGDLLKAIQSHWPAKTSPKNARVKGPRLTPNEQIQLMGLFLNQAKPLGVSDGPLPSPPVYRQPVQEGDASVRESDVPQPPVRTQEGDASVQDVDAPRPPVRTDASFDSDPVDLDAVDIEWVDTGQPQPPTYVPESTLLDGVRDLIGDILTPTFIELVVLDAVSPEYVQMLYGHSRSSNIPLSNTQLSVIRAAKAITDARAGGLSTANALDAVKDDPQAFSWVMGHIPSHALKALVSHPHACSGIITACEAHPSSMKAFCDRMNRNADMGTIFFSTSLDPSAASSTDSDTALPEDTRLHEEVNDLATSETGSVKGDDDPIIDNRLRIFAQLPPLMQQAIAGRLDVTACNKLLFNDNMRHTDPQTGAMSFSPEGMAFLVALARSQSDRVATYLKMPDPMNWFKQTVLANGPMSDVSVTDAIPERPVPQDVTDAIPEMPGLKTEMDDSQEVTDAIPEMPGLKTEMDDSQEVTDAIPERPVPKIAEKNRQKMMGQCNILFRLMSPQHVGSILENTWENPDLGSIHHAMRRENPVGYLTALTQHIEKTPDEAVAIIANAFGITHNGESDISTGWAQYLTDLGKAGNRSPEVMARLLRLIQTPQSADTRIEESLRDLLGNTPIQTLGEALTGAMFLQSSLDFTLAYDTFPEIINDYFRGFTQNFIRESHGAGVSGDPSNGVPQIPQMIRTNGSSSDRSDDPSNEVPQVPQRISADGISPDSIDLEWEDDAFEPPVQEIVDPSAPKPPVRETVELSAPQPPLWDGGINASPTPLDESDEASGYPAVPIMREAAPVIQAINDGLSLIDRQRMVGLYLDVAPQHLRGHTIQWSIEQAVIPAVLSNRATPDDIKNLTNALYDDSTKMQAFKQSLGSTDVVAMHDLDRVIDANYRHISKGGLIQTSDYAQLLQTGDLGVMPQDKENQAVFLKWFDAQAIPATSQGLAAIHNLLDAIEADGADSAFTDLKSRDAFRDLLCARGFAMVTACPWLQDPADPQSSLPEPPVQVDGGASMIPKPPVQVDASASDSVADTTSAPIKRNTPDYFLKKLNITDKDNKKQIDGIVQRIDASKTQLNRWIDRQYDRMARPSASDRYSELQQGVRQAYQHANIQWETFIDTPNRAFETEDQARLFLHKLTAQGMAAVVGDPPAADRLKKIGQRFGHIERRYPHLLSRDNRQRITAITDKIATLLNAGEMTIDTVQDMMSDWPGLAQHALMARVAESNPDNGRILRIAASANRCLDHMMTPGMHTPTMRQIDHEQQAIHALIEEECQSFSDAEDRVAVLKRLIETVQVPNGSQDASVQLARLRGIQQAIINDDRMMSDQKNPLNMALMGASSTIFMSKRSDLPLSDRSFDHMIHLLEGYESQAIPDMLGRMTEGMSRRDVDRFYDRVAMHIRTRPTNTDVPIIMNALGTIRNQRRKAGGPDAVSYVVKRDAAALARATTAPEIQDTLKSIVADPNRSPESQAAVLKQLLIRNPQVYVTVLDHLMVLTESSDVPNVPTLRGAATDAVPSSAVPSSTVSNLLADYVRQLSQDPGLAAVHRNTMKSYYGGHFSGMYRSIYAHNPPKRVAVNGQLPSADPTKAMLKRVATTDVAVFQTFLEKASAAEVREYAPMARDNLIQAAKNGKLSSKCLQKILVVGTEWRSFGGLLSRNTGTWAPINQLVVDLQQALVERAIDLGHSKSSLIPEAPVVSESADASQSSGGDVPAQPVLNPDASSQAVQGSDAPRPPVRDTTAPQPPVRDGMSASSDAIPTRPELRSTQANDPDAFTVTDDVKALFDMIKATLVHQPKQHSITIMDSLNQGVLKPLAYAFVFPIIALDTINPFQFQPKGVTQSGRGTLTVSEQINQWFNRKTNTVQSRVVDTTRNQLATDPKAFAAFLNHIIRTGSTGSASSITQEEALCYDLLEKTSNKNAIYNAINTAAVSEKATLLAVANMDSKKIIEGLTGTQSDVYIKALNIAAKKGLVSDTELVTIVNKLGQDRWQSLTQSALSGEDPSISHPNRPPSPEHTDQKIPNADYKELLPKMMGALAKQGPSSAKQWCKTVFSWLDSMNTSPESASSSENELPSVPRLVPASAPAIQSLKVAIIQNMRQYSPIDDADIAPDIRDLLKNTPSFTHEFAKRLGAHIDTIVMEGKPTTNKLDEKLMGVYSTLKAMQSAPNAVSSKKTVRGLLHDHGINPVDIAHIVSDVTMRDPTFDTAFNQLLNTRLRQVVRNDAVFNTEAKTRMAALRHNIAQNKRANPDFNKEMSAILKLVPRSGHH